MKRAQGWVFHVSSKFIDGRNLNVIFVKKALVRFMRLIRKYTMCLSMKRKDRM